MAHLGSWLRLTRAGFTLLRYDALIPKELSPLLPPIPRFFAGLLRGLFARRSRLRVGERYALAFERLGPAFIKLGQVLSTRGDIFGERFIADLTHLKDSLPPFAKAEAEAAILDAFGKPVAAIFADFGEVIGSASIAQAHRAALLDGREVAAAAGRQDAQGRRGLQRRRGGEDEKAAKRRSIAAAVCPSSATALTRPASASMNAVRSTCLSYPPASNTIGASNASRARHADSGVVASESL